MGRCDRFFVFNTRIFLEGFDCIYNLLRGSFVGFPDTLILIGLFLCFLYAVIDVINLAIVSLGPFIRIGVFVAENSCSICEMIIDSYGF